jgi:hypothetical protein
MAVPQRQIQNAGGDPVLVAAEIDRAIEHIQSAIAQTPDGSARRTLYDAAIYLDVARSMVRRTIE